MIITLGDCHAGMNEKWQKRSTNNYSKAKKLKYRKGATLVEREFATGEEMHKSISAIVRCAVQ
jgi:hypothetical protein